MNKTYRLIFLSISFLVLFFIGYNAELDIAKLFGDFWFTSGLVLLILLSLVDQPFFSKDANIFVNSITAGISLLTVPPSQRDAVFLIFLTSVLYLLVSSLILMFIRKNPLHEEWKSVQFFSRLNRNIGRPESIFSAFFLWGAVKQYGLQSGDFNTLLWFWIIFTILSIPTLAKTIEGIFKEQSESQIKEGIGAIFAVLSGNTYLVRSFDHTNKIAKVFDFVEFKYSIDEEIRRGVIVDIYFLNQELWMKILSTSEIEDVCKETVKKEKHILDYVYKLNVTEAAPYKNRFVGLVYDNTTVGKIKFIYSSSVEIETGYVLEVNVRDKRIFYQIIEGTAKTEELEGKDQDGLIIGEAIQIGKWDNAKLAFEKYGWVPSINAPVHIAADIPEPTLQQGECTIGTMPHTNFPIILNKELAITHHTAIIGVTGSGKSVFARKLLKELLVDLNTKLICIDFTKEYGKTLQDLHPVKIVDATIEESLFQAIITRNRELSEFANRRTQSVIDTAEQTIKDQFTSSISSFLQSENKLALFELPDLTNTTEILEYTKSFFQYLFKIAKDHHNYGKRVCIVLEEAHTIVPEFNFGGSADKSSQHVINSISQIALQGRKFDVGFIVITQRTANVSKTVLTQCNTIIAFQSFDKTSSDFLSNYFSADLISTLPNLKARHAIAVGKAFKSGVPIIFQVPEIFETIA